MLHKFDVETDVNHLYVGKSAGAPIKTEIEQAEESITILSPYVSAKYIQLLLEKQRQGVDVTLVCHDLKNVGPGGKLGYADLIKQHPNRDEDRHKLRATGLVACLTVGFLLSVLFAVFLVVWRPAYTSGVMLTSGSVYLCSMFLTTLVTRYFWEYRTHSYSYSSPLSNFCWLGDFSDSRFGDQDTVHAKVFVVDRRVAFVGSLNFTKSGFESSIETRVDIRHKESARRLASKIREYATAPSYRVNIQKFGEQYFYEPPNGPNSWRERVPFLP